MARPETPSGDATLWAVTKSTYPYPPDEFDVAVPGGAPVGVHRAPRSGWSSVWPFLLVAVICAGVAWGGITLLNGDPGAAQAETPGASASPDPSASASPPADPAASPSPPPAPEPVVDVNALLAAANLEASILVWNAEGTPGLAKAGADPLTSAGFTTVDVADWPDANEAVTVNTVWYGADRAETAAAVAAVLGIPAEQTIEREEVTVSDEAVWVVLMAQPTPAG